MNYYHLIIFNNVVIVGIRYIINYPQNARDENVGLLKTNYAP